MISEALRDRLEMISHLEPNWDGDDADPPNMDLLAFAQRLILRLVKLGIPEPQLGVTSCGTFDLVWDDVNIFTVLSEPGEGLQLIDVGPWTPSTHIYPDYSEAGLDSLVAALGPYLSPRYEKTDMSSLPSPSVLA
jgi:hypothetical protein